MVEEKSWNEFRNTGLLLYINQILHVFGWSIVINIDENGATSAYPARVNFRGFSYKSVSKSYIKISEYLKNNIDALEKEAKE